MEHGVRKHGHFGGEPGAPDAHAARRAILLVRKVHSDTAAILLIRDSDGDESRRKGLEQARDESPLKNRIVIGLCHPKRECWVLAGYAPQSKHERKVLASLVRKIGFDPCAGGSRLNDRGDGEKRSAKRVLRLLTGGDFERERLCWAAADLETLARNGTATGLTAFVDEVRRRLRPLCSND